MKKLLLGPIVFPNDLHARARAVNRVWTVSNGSFLVGCPRKIVFGQNRTLELRNSERIVQSVHFPQVRLTR